MDNLIRKQDAIDVKAEFLNECVIRDTEAQTSADRTYAKGWNGCNRHWIDAIKELPSVQQWTPCSDGLPEENEFYWATIYSREMQTAFCDKLFYGVPQLCEDKKLGWYFMHDNGDVEQVFNVKAWMPLPDPYRGESEDKPHKKQECQEKAMNHYIIALTGFRSDRKRGMK